MLETLFRAVGYGLCHQLPERSFFAGRYQLPVCARDTGIYLGFAVGLLALQVLSRGRRPSELPRWPVLLLVGLFVAALGADGVSSYAGLRATTNPIRLVTGILTGWGLATITFPMVNGQLWVRSGDGHVPSGRRETLWWLALPALVFGMVLWMLPPAGALYPLLLVAAIIVTFTAVNMVFVCLVPMFERKAATVRDAVLPFAIAVVLAFAELAAAAWLRISVERLLT